MTYCRKTSSGEYSCVTCVVSTAQKQTYPLQPDCLYVTCIHLLNTMTFLTLTGLGYRWRHKIKRRIYFRVSACCKYDVPAEQTTGGLRDVNSEDKHPEFIIADQKINIYLSLMFIVNDGNSRNIDVSKIYLPLSPSYTSHFTQVHKVTPVHIIRHHYPRNWVCQ